MYTYLHDAFAELERVFARHAEVDHGQRDCCVYEQSGHHRGHIHAQTAGRLRQVIDGHQVPGHQATDAERRVPEGKAGRNGTPIERGGYLIGNIVQNVTSWHQHTCRNQRK